MQKIYNTPLFIPSELAEPASRELSATAWHIEHCACAEKSESRMISAISIKGIYFMKRFMVQI